MKTLLTDIELWNEVIAEDREAFTRLFNRFYPLLFQYGSKLTNDTAVVEDAIQELFLELWQRKEKPAIASVRAYLLAALKFKLYKVLRQPLVVDIENNDGGLFEWSHETFIANEEGATERTNTVIAALNQLPVRQKEILYLRIYKGLSYEEIAVIMQVNYQVLRNLLSQALKTTRNLCHAPV